jgi:hypothetical protein
MTFEEDRDNSPLEEQIFGVLMIPPRMKGLCFVFFKPSGQAVGCGLGPASSCWVPALDVGPKKRPSWMAATTPTGREDFWV